MASASFVGDRQTLERVWINGERGITSMTSFEEAYEQLIEDSDAFGYLETYSKHPSLSEAQQKAVREYIDAFRDFDDLPFLKGQFVDSAALIGSPAWGHLERKARTLASLFGHNSYWRR